jgi:hypothetical protein
MKALDNKLTAVLFALLLAFLLPATTPCMGQAEGKKERTRMKLYYAKLTDGVKKITIGITAGSGKNMHGVANAEVALNAISGDTTLELARLQTDTTGSVELFVEPGYKFPVNEEGRTYLEAVYEGSDAYRAVSNEIEFEDLDFTLSFEEEDSIKYLKVVASKRDVDGNSAPVEGLEIMVGVERLFSVLPLEKIETDESGEAVLEFPNDIPGDSTGMITVQARIEDDEMYGTVEKAADVQWGTPVSYVVEPLPRQLYSDEAPLWMVIAVFVILIGAWYHFFLSVYKLKKMRDSSISH